MEDERSTVTTIRNSIALALEACADRVRPEPASEDTEPEEPNILEKSFPG